MSAEWDETVPAEPVDVADCAAPGCDEVTVGHELAVTGTTVTNETRVVSIALCPRHSAALDNATRRTSPQLQEQVYQLVCESTGVGGSVISNVELAEGLGKSLRTIEFTMHVLKQTGRIAIHYGDDRQRVIVPLPF